MADSPLPTLDFSSRVAGVLAPVFALRSNLPGADLGCGDTRAAREFIDWAADAGLRVMQFLPIHATGADHSPYRPVSSQALDVSTVCCDPAELPDVPAPAWTSALAEARLLRLDDGGVNYPAVKALRERLLRAAFARFEAEADPARRDAFAAFRKASADWLEPFTLHHAFTARMGGEEAYESTPDCNAPSLADLRRWQEELPAEERAALEHARMACAYAQWIAREQWLAVRRHAEARGVALMGDLPFGLSFHASDVAAHPDLFELAWSGGAPKDPMFKPNAFAQKWGQNWSVPPFRWSAHQRDDLAWWRARITGLASIFHVLRIDHVLGFYRMFAFPWRAGDNEKYVALDTGDVAEHFGGRVPRFLPEDDATPGYRLENLFRGHAFLERLRDAAGPARLVVEDIGTVPGYVPPDLQSLGLPGYAMPMARRTRSGRFEPGDKYPRKSVAMWGTHDNLPLAALWAEWEAADRGDEAAAQRLKNENAPGRAEIAEFAGVPKDAREAPWSDQLHEQLVEALLASNSWLALFTMADLLGTPDRINAPGTPPSENWTRRLPQSAEEMRRDPAIASKLARLREALRRTGRDQVRDLPDG